MPRLILSCAVAALASPTLAQPVSVSGPGRPAPYAAPDTTGSIIVEDNNTGGEPSLIVPRGSNGADTFQSDSAAGGNAKQPERAIPQFSGGGSNGGG